MDDNQFDDIIKGKVSGYQEPGFDPAALAGLHYRMAAAGAVWPWYSVYRTELLVGTGLIVCTLTILWNQWSLGSKEHMLLMDNLRASKNQDEQIGKLQNEIEYLRSSQPDTVSIIEVREQNSSGYTTLLNRIAGLEATIESYWNQPLTETPLSPEESTHFFEKAEADKLESGNEATGDDHQDIVHPYRLAPRTPGKKSVRTTWNGMNAAVEAKAGPLSVKAMRDIENHYQRGVGVRAGPTLEISKGIYSIGNGRVGFTGGLLAEFILSPWLSVETGGKYVRRVYQVSDPQDLTLMPNVEESLGTPKNADIDSWILEIPFNLKYRYPTSIKSHWLAGIGFSPMLFTRQVLEYDYVYPGNPSASIYSIYEKGKPQLYSGTLNFLWGLSNEVRKNNIIEASVYYQYGLSGIGVEKTKQSFLGVRGVYWFKVR